MARRKKHHGLTKHIAKVRKGGKKGGRRGGKRAKK